MATDVLLEVKLKNRAPGQDDTTDAWVFHQGAGDVDIAGVQTQIVTFYNTIAPVVYGPQIDPTSGHATSSYYDIAAHLNGSPHGSPINVDFWTLSGLTAGSSAPAQLAIVADFHADLTGVVEFGPGTRPRSRLRGRHYLGPLKVTAMDYLTTAPYQALVDGTTISTIVGAYEAFLAAVPAGTEWGVWSRKNASIAPVIGGWIDSVPASQRRVQDREGVKVFWP